MGILVSVLGPGLDLGLGIGEGKMQKGLEESQPTLLFSLLRLRRDSRSLVPTHLTQKLQDGPFPLCEHINQGLDEAGAFFVMSVGKVTWGLQRSGLRKTPMEMERWGFVWCKRAQRRVDPGGVSQGSGAVGRVGQQRPLESVGSSYPPLWSICGGCPYTLGWFGDCLL